MAPSWLSPATVSYHAYRPYAPGWEKLCAFVSISLFTPGILPKLNYFWHILHRRLTASSRLSFCWFDAGEWPEQRSRQRCQIEQTRGWFRGWQKKHFAVRMGAWVTVTHFEERKYVSVPNNARSNKTKVLYLSYAEADMDWVNAETVRPSVSHSAFRPSHHQCSLTCTMNWWTVLSRLYNSSSASLTISSTISKKVNDTHLENSSHILH